MVVGAGHAGCEAALAAAKMGCRTLLLTLNLDRIAWQPCNPAVGGPAKSQLVHEVDALGGWIGRLADRTYLQKRVLNKSKVSGLQQLKLQAIFEGSPRVLHMVSLCATCMGCFRGHSISKPAAPIPARLPQPKLIPGMGIFSLGDWCLVVFSAENHCLSYLK